MVARAAPSRGKSCRWARVLRESVGPSKCGDRLAQWSVGTMVAHGAAPSRGKSCFFGARAAGVGVIRLSAVIGLRSGGGERTLCGPRAAENGPCVASALWGLDPVWSQPFTVVGGCF